MVKNLNDKIRNTCLLSFQSINQACFSQISGGSDIEISLEANPSDIIETALEFKQAGVNRLSLGIQSFQDTTLQFFNRDHDAETGRRSLEICLNVFGSRRVSGDLIFGVPGQTVQDWLQELRVLISLGKLVGSRLVFRAQGIDHSR